MNEPITRTVSYRLLVVEDDVHVGPAFQRALRRRGHEVDLVGSIRGAEICLEEGGYDVVVLDRDVIDGNAWSWASRRTIGVPVVHMSATGETIVGDFFFRKGIDPMNRLIELVQAAIDRRAAS